MERSQRRLIALPVRRLVRRLVDMLPSPRDKTMRIILRSLLDFSRGREPNFVQRDELELGRQRDEAERVRLGWLLVDAYERLGFGGASKAFARDLSAWHQHAEATVRNLQPYGTDVSAYEGRNNRIRFRRMLDFAMAGDRVFDVGVGRGYLGGLLLRDAGVEAYHGIDVVKGYLETTLRMLTANDLDGADVKIELGDLYKLSREDIDRSRANFVICCEVLEHVDNPEAALMTLAAALPEGADLLFSVPLLGRLENVWGHVTVFETARLMAMTENAGLHVHHVEPVANLWTFVLASRSREPSLRASQAISRLEADFSRPLIRNYDFVPIDPNAMAPAPSVGSVVDLEVVQDLRVRCQIKAANTDGDGAFGGIEFSVDGLSSLKLHFLIKTLDDMRRLNVDALAGEETSARWTWEPTLEQLDGRDRLLIALRPGVSTGQFKAQDHKPAVRPDRVRVSLDVRRGGVAEFEMRAAYLP